MCLDMGKLPLTLQSVPANVNREDVIVPPPSWGTQNKKITGSCIVQGTSQRDPPKVCLEQEAWDTKQEHKVLVCPHYQVKCDISWGGLRASSHFMRLDAARFQIILPKITPEIPFLFYKTFGSQLRLWKIKIHDLFLNHWKHPLQTQCQVWKWNFDDPMWCHPHQCGSALFMIIFNKQNVSHEQISMKNCLFLFIMPLC